MSLSITHETVNNILAGVVVVLGIYIALGPFWPNVQLWFSGIFDANNGYAYSGQLTELEGVEGGDGAPDGNTLVIPAISLDEKVVEGEQIGVIENGDVWRRPNTSTPDVGGNTVIIGHRWSYSNPSTFYHLDKMSVGDKFSVYWNDEEYVYEVSETKVVPATAVDIEGPSEEAKLTLYTCTPLWTAKDRLVVVSKLIVSPEQLL